MKPLSSIFTLRRLFLWGNVILLALFVGNLVKDQRRGWQWYQKEFKRREIARIETKIANAPTPDLKDAANQELKVAQKMPIEIRQIWSTDINAVDRCITCHLGYDPLSNSSLTTEYKDQPFSAPDNDKALEIHRAHNVEKFGCVVCHGGQGLATEVKAAHGEVEHWEKPLLKGTMLQASCVQCHDNHGELLVKGEVYTSEIVRAKKLVQEAGCIGCHQVGGEGGVISVDFKDETSNKPLSRIDFTHTGLPQDQWTLQNWIKVHLVQDPARVTPGDPKALLGTEPIAPSGMPPYLMNDKDADAITAWILGLKRTGIPPEFLTLRAPPAEPTSFASAVAQGRHVYEKNGCAACHGADARGGIRNYNSQLAVTPNLRRAVATYTRDELREKISDGVPFIARHDPSGPQPPFYMPAWKSKIKGEELESLITYLISIKE
jgi:mono/diheme cytochrome c family protein